MFDDTNPNLIPGSAQAVGGYVNGKWQTFATIVKKFPNAKHLSIAVTAAADAECLDVERGDAVNSQAPAWVKRQIARGVHRPVIYTSVSNVGALLKVLNAAGIHREDVRIWSAHYNYRAHICGPSCGFGNFNADATQYTDRYSGKSLDATLCGPNFFLAVAPKPVPKPPAPKPPAPKPAPKPVPAPPPVVPPAPKPNVVPKGMIEVVLTNKDGSKLTELDTPASFMRRAQEFAKGLFRAMSERRSL